MNDLAALPSSKGIDARALAAEPPPRYTIRRFDTSVTASQPRVNRERAMHAHQSNREAFVSGEGGFSGARTATSRGDFGGTRGGRGGRGGSARGASRGARGGNRGRGGKRVPKPKKPEEEGQQPWTKLERDALGTIEMGPVEPYEPKTSWQNLFQDLPRVATSTALCGLKQVIHQRIIADAMKHLPVEQQSTILSSFSGHLFETQLERDRLEDLINEELWVHHQAQVKMKKVGKYVRFSLKGMGIKARENLLKQEVAGEHNGPRRLREGELDMMKVSANVAKRNQTWNSTPESFEKLQAKLQAYMPQPKVAKDFMPL